MKTIFYHKRLDSFFNLQIQKLLQSYTEVSNRRKFVSNASEAVVSFGDDLKSVPAESKMATLKDGDRGQKK